MDLKTPPISQFLREARPDVAYHQWQFKNVETLAYAVERKEPRWFSATEMRLIKTAGKTAYQSFMVRRDSQGRIPFAAAMAAFIYIAGHENYREASYPDVTRSSIGFGTKAPSSGELFSPADAFEKAMWHLTCEVFPHLKFEMSLFHFIALADLVYNRGPNENVRTCIKMVANRTSTIVQNRGWTKDAELDFVSQWTHLNDPKVYNPKLNDTRTNVLRRRRSDELEMIVDYYPDEERWNPLQIYLAQGLRLVKPDTQQKLMPIALSGTYQHWAERIEVWNLAPPQTDVMQMMSALIGAEMAAPPKNESRMVKLISNEPEVKCYAESKGDSVLAMAMKNAGR